MVCIIIYKTQKQSWITICRILQLNEPRLWEYKSVTSCLLGTYYLTAIPNAVFFYIQWA